MIEQVVVTNAWVEHEGTVFLNPALKTYELGLLRMKQAWEKGADVSPLSWYAQQADIKPATLLTHLYPDLPQNVKQCWVASPYHAQLSRSSLRVLPDTMLDWTASMGQQLCEILNPLLTEDGLKLCLVGEVLLLTSEHKWDVVCEDFAYISGKTLPDRQQGGQDMGRWLRLLSEIQMTLHSHPIHTAQGLQIHGLWMWGDVIGQQKLDVQLLPNVASKNIYLNSVLQALHKQQDATVIVSEAEHLPSLLPTVLPEQWLLLGTGKSVSLKNNMLTSALSRVSKPKWKGTGVL